MPQLRWTLLILGVLFIALLWWIERRQRRRPLDSGPVEHDVLIGPPAGRTDGEPAPAFRGGGQPQPTLNLPEMRARDPVAHDELPVVEIEDESLTARRVEPKPAAAVNPPTLSLPVMESGPVRRERPAEGRPADRRPFDPPAMSGAQWIRPANETAPVPRLDTPAGRRGTPRVEPTFDITPGPLEARDDGEAERAFNEAVFGDTGAVEPGNETDVELAAHIAEAAEARRAAEAAKAATDAAGEVTIAQDEDAPPGQAGPGVRPAVGRPDSSEAGRATSEPDFTGASRIMSGPDSTQQGLAEPGSDEPHSAQPVAPLFTAADVTPIKEPIVDWPPDDRRKVVALRLVAPPPERLPGRALRLALASEGFVLGKFQIFHKPDSSGRAVLSAANLSKPGTFDIGTMDSQRFGGLSLFAVLPGPKPPLKAFEDLLSTARNLNERLNGALQDERGGPLTPTRIAALRESVSTEVST
jgi:FtsZ-interacting cell division protein ZipA